MFFIHNHMMIVVKITMWLVVLYQRILYHTASYLKKLYNTFVVIVCLVEAQRTDILLTAYQPCQKETTECIWKNLCQLYNAVMSAALAAFYDPDFPQYQIPPMSIVRYSYLGRENSGLLHRHLNYHHLWHKSQAA